MGTVTTDRRARILWATAGAAALASLASRDVSRWSWTVAVAGGLVGLAAPASANAVVNGRTWIVSTGMGILAFLAAQSLLATQPVRANHLAVVAGVAAAFGEEALFRRFLYGSLERWGVPFAVAGSAVAFGLVHVPMYGWRSLPVDVGAGFVFGWQRWATGGWTSSAVTHSFANVIAHI